MSFESRAAVNHAMTDSVWVRNFDLFEQAKNQRKRRSLIGYSFSVITFRVAGPIALVMDRESAIRFTDRIRLSVDQNFDRFLAYSVHAKFQRRRTAVKTQNRYLGGCSSSYHRVR